MTSRSEKERFLKLYSESNGTAINNTDPIFPLSWTVYGEIVVFLTVLAWLTNGIVLIAFLKNRNLLTSFSVYLVNLLVSNLIQTAVVNTLDIMDSISLYWWMGSRACDLMQYGLYVVGGGIVYSHVLISANRIWAVTFPVSYRNAHRKRISVLTCFLMWMVLNVVCAPGLALESLYYRVPLVIGDCTLNPSTQWKLVAMLVVFDVPIILVFLSYPYLWYLQRKRLRVVEIIAEPRTHQRITTLKPSTASTRSTKSTETFYMLTAVTISLLFCWVPMELYVTINSFTSLESNSFYDVSVLLYYLQPVLDPLLFMIAFKDLRSEVKSLIMWK